MQLNEFLKNHKVEEVELSKLLLCEDCKNIFVWYEGERLDDAKRCPACQDKYQQRPSIVEKRICLQEFDGVEIMSLPASWEGKEAHTHTDFPYWSICVKGSRFGRSWSGRIDIFAKRGFKVGEIVKVRVMKSTHLVKKRRFQAGHIQKSPYDPPTHTVERTLDINSSETEGVTEGIETRQYLVLEETDATPSGDKLVWETAHTKTTIKGYGRQYHADLDTRMVIFVMTCKGGYRSGRANTTGVLAIVSEIHPLIHTFKEGEEEKTTYIR